MNFETLKKIENLLFKRSENIYSSSIFRTDLDKRNIIEDSFIYLYDINCVYHKVEFDNLVELKERSKNG